MTIDKTENGGSVCLKLTGRLDTVTAPMLDAALQACSDSAEILLDFERVEYISSAGLRVLLAAQRRASARHGSMRLTHVNETVSEVFDMTGFSGILTVE